MTGRPHVLLSAAVSLDGHLDNTGPDRLMLSGPEDFERVDALRADSDAILVGANTLRSDDSRLLVASAERRAERVRRGLPEHPLKVTVTASGGLASHLRLWHSGGDKLVFTVDATADALRDRLGGLAEVVSTGPVIDWGALLDELGRRGVRRLMVEGGQTVHTQLVAGDLADEIRLAVAPVLVGDAAAPRFLGTAEYPGGPASRMRLLGADVVGDVVLLRLAPKDREPEDAAPEDVLRTGDAGGVPPEDAASGGAAPGGVPSEGSAPEGSASGDAAPEDPAPDDPSAEDDAPTDGPPERGRPR
ncbi:RibD family protein [Streptantibioticus silvisoli]|uniref:RibD family protein n=1 Tax=Streptantibioticus silvisoli TaxID=2705255 RepID=UPI003F6B9524